MKIIHASTLLLTVMLLSTSCNALNDSEYSILCDIYAENVSQKISTNEKEVKINIAVQKKLPDFYNSQFKIVMLAEPAQRYKLFKQMAKKSSGLDWKCAPAKNFYATEFKTKSKKSQSKFK